MKVVINSCYGGAGLSPKACEWLYERGYRGNSFAHPVDTYYGNSTFCNAKDDLAKWNNYKTGKVKSSMFLTPFSPDEKFVLSTHLNSDTETRTNPLLIECLETLGEDASGDCAKLTIVEIPDGINWEITEYDGSESVEEVHRSWR